MVFFFDFSYRYNIFLVIWIIILGLVGQDNRIFVIKQSLFVGFVFVLVQLFIISWIISPGNYFSSSLNFRTNNKLGKYYEEIGDREKSLYYYEQEFFGKPMTGILRLQKIFDLSVSLYGEDQGRTVFGKFIKEVKNKLSPPKNSDLMKIIIQFCLDREIKC